MVESLNDFVQNTSMSGIKTYTIYWEDNFGDPEAETSDPLYSGSAAEIPWFLLAYPVIDVFIARCGTPEEEYVILLRQ